MDIVFRVRNLLHEFWEAQRVASASLERNIAILIGWSPHKHG